MCILYVLDVGKLELLQEQLNSGGVKPLELDLVIDGWTE
jgi:hypothetical protein